MRRVFLVILMVLQILSAVYLFFFLIGSSVIWAVISAVIAVMQIVLTLSVVINIGDIEELRAETQWLRERMKHLEEFAEDPRETAVTVPALKNSEISRGVWECIKCGTVNKSGTSQCINCKSEYSSWVNPTDSCAGKKKISRWVKYK